MKKNLSITFVLLLIFSITSFAGNQLKEKQEYLKKSVLDSKGFIEDMILELKLNENYNEDYLKLVTILLLDSGTEYMSSVNANARESILSKLKELPSEKEAESLRLQMREDYEVTYRCLDDFLESSPSFLVNNAYYKPFSELIKNELNMLRAQNLSSKLSSNTAQAYIDYYIKKRFTEFLREQLKLKHLEALSSFQKGSILNYIHNKINFSKRDLKRNISHILGQYKYKKLVISNMFSVSQLYHSFTLALHKKDGSKILERLFVESFDSNNYTELHKVTVEFEEFDYNNYPYKFLNPMPWKSNFEKKKVYSAEKSTLLWSSKEIDIMNEEFLKFVPFLFKFKNISKKPISILNLKANSIINLNELNKKIYQPGEEDELSGFISMPPSSDKKIKGQIMIETDGGSLEKLLILVRNPSVFKTVQLGASWKIGETKESTFKILDLKRKNDNLDDYVKIKEIVAPSGYKGSYERTVLNDGYLIRVKPTSPARKGYSDLRILTDKMSEDRFIYRDYYLKVK